MENNTLQIVIGLLSPVLATLGTYVVFSNKVTKIDTLLGISTKEIQDDKKDIKDHSKRIAKLEVNFEIIDKKIDRLETKVDETNKKIDKYFPLLEQIPKILQKIS